LKDQNLKKLIEDNLQSLQNMSVPEYTLYQKWLEINNMYQSVNNNVNAFFDVPASNLPSTEQAVKDNIWIPKNPNDYLNLEPEVVHVNSKEDKKIWRILRIFTHRMSWKQNPGRFLNFYVVDKKTGKYLGIFSMGSDFINVGGRDKYVGWTKEHKMDGGRLKYTCMGSTISSTQPLGYNYLGGKLISLLVCSEVPENIWNSKYNESLVGITTTSLYGGFSQYNNLKYWKKCKSSEGKIPLEPSEDVYLKIKEWCRKNFPEEYNKATRKREDGSIPSHSKTKITGKVFKELKIKQLSNNAPRGVYFCSLYENTRDFLSMKTDTLGNKKFDNSVKVLSELWKEKYAKKRVKNLENPKNGILFYDELIGMSWEETKQKYLND